MEASPARAKDQDICDLFDFDGDDYPPLVCHKIFDFLVDGTPLPDELVLTCKSFMCLTYNHTNLIHRFHLRFDPNFEFSNANNAYNFQIGGKSQSYHQRSIILSGMDSVSTSTQSDHFDFRKLREFSIGEKVALNHAIPFFNYFAPFMHIMALNNSLFLVQTPVNDLTTADKIDYINKFGHGAASLKADKHVNELKLNTMLSAIYSFPPVFEKCQLLDLTLGTRLRRGVSVLNSGACVLDGCKFPNLVYVQLNLDTLSVLPRVQMFLDGTPSLAILSLNLSFGVADAAEARQHGKPMLQIPKNVEILALGLNKYAVDVVDIDYIVCKDKIKYISVVDGGDSIVSLFSEKRREKLVKTEAPEQRLQSEEKRSEEMYTLDGGDCNHTICKGLKYVCVLDYNLLSVLKRNGVFLWRDMQVSDVMVGGDDELEACTTGEMIEKNPTFYAPYMEKSVLFKSKQYFFKAEFPNFEQVKQDIESLKARKLLRYLKDHQKMHYLLPFFDNPYFNSSAVVVNSS